MAIILQDSRHPGEMLFAFDELVDNTLNELRWAVAYTTLEGCRTLVERIIGRAGRGSWDNTEKLLITSFDYGITRPEALVYLRDEVGMEVSIANVSVLERPLLRPVDAFHPKLFMFRGERLTALCGSANLTASALTGNTECGVAISDLPAEVFHGGWQFLMDSVTPLTDGLLETYRERRQRLPVVPPVDDQQPAPPHIIAGNLPILLQEIQRGNVNPLDFQYLWVEAGSMSSGGSHSQLELPRGGNRFFGFDFQNYGPQHEQIGFPRLTSFDRAWTNRPLAWHGNNRMERFNLPTQTQSGFVYRDTAVLFRRHEGGFELVVAPWDDALAISWRTASTLAGQVYRLGENSPRVCGMF